MIYLFLSYASSGATLVNQCLAGSSQVVMLSELNPLGGGTGKEKENSYKTIKEQLRHWYDIEIRSDHFADAACEAEETIGDQRKLIIRDWSYINFTKHPANNDSPPNKLLIIEELQSHTQIKSMALIRHPIDVWISRNFPPIEEFVKDYGNFLKAVKEINCPIFRYEDFVASPVLELTKILDFFDMKESAQHLVDTYYMNTNVNGSTTQVTRGAKQRVIAPLPRKIIFIGSLLDIQKSKSMKQLCYEWNYSPHYFESIRHLSKFAVTKLARTPKIIKNKMFPSTDNVKQQ